MSTWEERQSWLWGVINPDGTVTARGRQGDEGAQADQDVLPPGSIAYYNAEDGTWICSATGRPAIEGPAKPPSLSDEEIAHRHKLRQAQRDNPGRLVCVLCTSVPCSCTKCPTCGMTEQARYGGCPRGCGKPTTPPPAPQSGTTSGGSMASFEEIKATIGMITDKAGSAQGGLQKAHQEVEEALGMMLRLSEGSGQADVSGAVAALSQALQSIADAQQMLGAGVQTAEGVAARQ